MQKLHLAATSLNLTPLDFDGNRDRIISSINRAKERGAHIMCLPELTISGYGCEDAFFLSHVAEESLRALLEIVPHTSGIAVAVGLPLRVHNTLYNTAAFLVDGALKGFVCKKHLPGEGIHYEPRWFAPWPVGKVEWITLGESHCPVGDLVFDLCGIRVGFEICHDAWVSDRPCEKLIKRGVDIILNPSASHAALGKYEVRKDLVVRASKDFGVTYVFANHLGNEAGRAIYDGDTLIAHGGEIVASGQRFSFHESVCTSFVTSISPKEKESDENVIVCSLSTSSKIEPVSSLKAHTLDWELSPTILFEEFSRSVALGLFDYLRKTRSHGFALSLSGGADSAAVACLVSLMIHFGMHELGEISFREKLSFIPNFTSENPRSALRQLLTAAYQSTPQSGEITHNAAKLVADSLGAEFLDISLDSILSEYLEKIGTALNHEFSWKRDDLTLQNIQARVRAPSIWLIANIKNALLLSTGNRSEAAVGYATMDGDTSGGLSPIAGIDKHFLKNWLRWLEKTGHQESGSFPFLSCVTTQEPTAELRPQEMHQLDEKDLMPYEILSTLEYGFLCERRSPEECEQLLREKFNKKYDVTLLSKYTTLFFELWARSQWKRERLAPSFHIDKFSVDSRTWCRFPILSKRLH